MSDVQQRRKIAGTVLIVVGLVLFLLQFVGGLHEGLVLALVGASFLVAYAYRPNYGFLIPGCILVGLGLGLTVQRFGSAGGDLRLVGLGAGFVAIYLVALAHLRMNNPWPLIPGGILLVVGVAPESQTLEWLFEIGWPLIIVLIGVFILVGGLWRTGEEAPAAAGGRAGAGEHSRREGRAAAPSGGAAGKVSPETGPEPAPPDPGAGAGSSSAGADSSEAGTGPSDAGASSSEAEQEEEDPGSSGPGRIAGLLFLAALVGLPSTLVGLPSTIAAQEPTLALVGGRVLDGYGGPLIEDGVVLVEGERIVAVGTGEEVEVPEGTPVLSTEGMTVMPGLWDMHVHLMILGHGDYERWDQLYGERNDLVMPIAAEQLLMAGITSARDVGAPLEISLEMRRRIADGEIPGPRLYVTGPFLQRAPYEEWQSDYRWGVDGAEDARARTQRLVDAGVDAIKLVDQDQLTGAEVAAIVETAHAGGLKVVAHAHRMDEIRVGLEHGVDDFEHTGLGTAPGYAPDVLQGLRERNSSLYWTPTISPLYVMRFTGEVFPERLDAPGWRETMPEEMADEIRQSLAHIPRLPYYALFPSRIPRLPDKFAQLRETGVRMLIGTDAGIPSMFHNDATWREMATWEQLGVPPMEIIQSATLWPARFFGVEDEVGTLAPGLLADVIAVRGDPLTRMDVLQDVDIVVQGGRVVKGPR